ncbi:hypothetical protein [Paenibacillus oceani]|uniref:Uncharacterized protein n=1 Tax=Paenibacillus oceani TaxID=2772510 RepID=A0A927H1P7_9BACL|nr:hypothetical protein [Paenibacillus oceani]MBD2864558.1 hypothetical protein [Paenibacillus oceani]
MTEHSTDHSMFEQTAFETAGIPTPYDQQDIGSTDGVSDAIQSIMDHIEEENSVSSTHERGKPRPAAITTCGTSSRAVPRSSGCAAVVQTHENRDIITQGLGVDRSRSVQRGSSPSSECLFFHFSGGSKSERIMKVI